MDAIATLFQHPTKEISLQAFERIWNQGGHSQTGNQFSNCDHHSYLWTVDLDKKDEIAQEKQAFQDWYESIPKVSTCAPYGGTWVEPENWDDRKKASDWNWHLKNLSTAVDNITDNLQVGWVVGFKHASQHDKTQPQPLPKNWDVVYAEFYRYGSGSIDKQIVARNNHDGTVQVFRPSFYK